MQFIGKTALVTGGTAGIGRAIALAFAKKGASVAIFGTNEERPKTVVQEMESLKIRSAKIQLFYCRRLASQRCGEKRSAAFK